MIILLVFLYVRQKKIPIFFNNTTVNEICHYDVNMEHNYANKFKSSKTSEMKFSSVPSQRKEKKRMRDLHISLHHEQPLGDQGIQV